MPAKKVSYPAVAFAKFVVGILIALIFPGLALKTAEKFMGIEFLTSDALGNATCAGLVGLGLAITVGLIIYGTLRWVQE